MAEFLIQALSETAPLRYWRGDIIQDYADGACKEPPSPASGKVILKVPGLTQDASRTQMQEWWRRLSYSIVSSDLPTDTHRVRVAGSGVNPNSGIGKITREMVENYLNGWSLTVVGLGDNWVEFDANILAAIRSRSFWRGLDIAGATLTETSYAQATGVHRCRVNYSATAITGDEAERAALENGAAIVSHNRNTKVLTFDISRATVRQRFQDDVKQRVEAMLVRRKYRFTEASVAAMEANGGWLTVSEAEYNSFFRNKLND